MASAASALMTAASLETISPRSVFISTRTISPSRVSLATKRTRFSVRASVETDGSSPAPTEATPIPDTPVDKAAAAIGAPKGVRVNPSGAAVSVFEGGKAQETINGRAAMIGFIAAVGAEISTGDSIVQQLTLKGGLPLLLVPATFAAILVGSFAPRVFDVKENGLDTPAKPFGPFTPAAELLNGRAAMIGFASLLIIEGIKKSALF